MFHSFHTDRQTRRQVDRQAKRNPIGNRTRDLVCTAIKLNPQKCAIGLSVNVVKSRFHFAAGNKYF